MDNKIKRECPVCEVVYHADPARIKCGRQTTCGRLCSYEFRAAKQQKQAEQTCPVCGKLFSRAPSQIKAKHGNTCCSLECAYQVRKRIVLKPYVVIASYDRCAAVRKSWETRREAGKPYPDAARNKARANLIKNLNALGGVSKFERKAAQVLRLLGFNVADSARARNVNGTFGAVFDLVLPERRLIIECHGTYWHGGRWTWQIPVPVQIKNLAYEERKARFAFSAGYDLRILWESEFKKDPAGALLSVVR